MGTGPGTNSAPSSSPKHLPALKSTLCSENVSFCLCLKPPGMHLTIIKTKSLTENNRQAHILKYEQYVVYQTAF